MSQEQKAGRQDEETAVPEIDIVGDTIEEIAEAGARILPHPKQPPRRAEQPRHPEKEKEEEEYHVGGVRGPQEPGPWGSDEAVRDDPGWGHTQSNPMDEGSE
jgi:hypothetical protein